jgi:hypothetical protein
MNSEHVQAIVGRALSTWRAPEVTPGSTAGVPWTEERYRAEIAGLQAAIVAPYKQRFLLDETYEHAIASEKSEAEYWVVAATPDTLVWFDETTGDFGLGRPAPSHSLPRSIGVRGDLVGSFCAR